MYENLQSGGLWWSATNFAIILSTCIMNRPSYLVSVADVYRWAVSDCKHWRRELHFFYILQAFCLHQRKALPSLWNFLGIGEELFHGSKALGPWHGNAMLTVHIHSRLLPLLSAHLTPKQAISSALWKFYLFIYLFFGGLISDKFSLCSSGCHGIYHVDKAGL